MRNTASGTHAHTPNSPRFTPGPWRCLGQRFIVAANGAGLPVCQVLPAGVGVEQADANEHLITAAPELFAALAAIVAECNRVAEDAGKDLIPNRLLDQARIALELAQEGRS